ncbi:hypothetical protein KIS1582_0266 [Cytobacillus firmus]|uniref:Uncharacterized protein n=1 Tax=Cytobacillus firmus TaxID=1399 RepID=A0A800NGS2_CYTFI|nr:hypothetical protein KIS1582_0266 [Cytobacillus firmus]
MLHLNLTGILHQENKRLMFCRYKHILLYSHFKNPLPILFTGQPSALPSLS